MTTSIRVLAANILTLLGSRQIPFAIVVTMLACGRGDQATVRDTVSAGDSMGMPAMAGMVAKDSSGKGPADAEVVFSAAQIAHGHVSWAAVGLGPATSEVEVAGQLVPNEDRTVRLAAQAEGRVLAVHVSPGDRVTPGTRLVSLQSQDASMAQSDLAKAQAELTSRQAFAAFARSARDRAERLVVLKAIPRQDYERAMADDELAQSAVAQAQAEQARARSAVAQLGAEGPIGHMVLRAPAAGVIIARDAVPGAVVAAGMPLVTVTDPTTLWLTAAVNEQVAATVRVGSRVRFTVTSFPTDTFSARVQSVSASFDPVTRSLPIRAAVANRDRRLRPEMFAKVWLVGRGTGDVYTVPDASMQRMDDKTVVFIAHPGAAGGARFQKRVVQLGPSAGGRTAIVHGLEAGALVVVRGAYAVKAQFAKGTGPRMEM